ncbi:MAG: tetratricopeptide repeat protein [Syntrophobacteraceae bacterium]|jgi:tetratricopeptide (TPR) repeat protein
MTKSLALLSVALLLVLSGCATAQHEQNARQLQDSGEKYLAAGETADALRFLTEAEQKSPDDPTIQYDLALAYDRRGLQDKAFTCLKNALKIKPAYSEAQNAIGALYARRGQYQLAQEAFQKALDDPFYKTPQLAAYNLGSLHEKKGEIEKALTDYQQAVKFEPSYGTAWFRIGQINEQLHRDDEARHAYGKAVVTSPDLAEANLRYGILSYLAGDMDSALLSLNRVGKIAPNTSMADEARMYLQKMSTSGARTTRERPPASSYTPPGEIEIISNEGGKSQRTMGSLPSQLPPQSAPPVVTDDLEKSQSIQAQPELPKETKASAARDLSAPTDDAAPAPARTSEGSQSQACKYIVQLGSFVDRDKAEEIQKSLVAKGYSAIVKPVKDRALGKVFVIQLRPVNNISTATTLTAQLGGELEGEPVIIKVPSK